MLLVVDDLSVVGFPLPTKEARDTITLTATTNLLPHPQILGKKIKRENHYTIIVSFTEGSD